MSSEYLRNYVFDVNVRCAAVDLLQVVLQLDFHLAQLLELLCFDACSILSTTVTSLQNCWHFVHIVQLLNRILNRCWQSFTSLRQWDLTLWSLFLTLSSSYCTWCSSASVMTSGLDNSSLTIELIHKVFSDDWSTASPKMVSFCFKTLVASSEFLIARSFCILRHLNCVNCCSKSVARDLFDILHRFNGNTIDNALTNITGKCAVCGERWWKMIKIVNSFVFSCST